MAALKQYRADRRAPLWLALLATLLRGFAGATPCEANSSPGSLEMAIKASYLYKFAPFVQWPPRAFASTASPLRICVAGDDVLSALVGEAVRGQRMHDHPMIVAHFATADAASMAVCQILFLGNGVQPATDTLRGVAGQPVLTVTDRDRGGSGGIIQFVTQGSRVRFAVDVAAANSAGLQISSKLLGLALQVRR
jgi:hypothetical protein